MEHVGQKQRERDRLLVILLPADGVMIEFPWIFVAKCVVYCPPCREVGAYIITSLLIATAHTSPIYVRIICVCVCAATIASSGNKLYLSLTQSHRMPARPCVAICVIGGRAAAVATTPGADVDQQRERPLAQLRAAASHWLRRACTARLVVVLLGALVAAVSILCARVRKIVRCIRQRTGVAGRAAAGHATHAKQTRWWRLQRHATLRGADTSAINWMGACWFACDGA